MGKHWHGEQPAKHLLHPAGSCGGHCGDWKCHALRRGFHEPDHELRCGHADLCSELSRCERQRLVLRGRRDDERQRYLHGCGQRRRRKPVQHRTHLRVPRIFLLAVRNCPRWNRCFHQRRNHGNLHDHIRSRPLCRLPDLRGWHHSCCRPAERRVGCSDDADRQHLHLCGRHCPDGTNRQRNWPNQPLRPDLRKRRKPSLRRRRFLLGGRHSAKLSDDPADPSLLPLPVWQGHSVLDRFEHVPAALCERDHLSIHDRNGNYALRPQRRCRCSDFRVWRRPTAVQRHVHCHHGTHSDHPDLHDGSGPRFQPCTGLPDQGVSHQLVWVFEQDRLLRPAERTVLRIRRSNDVRCVAQ